jgi:molecular chaperone DnaK
MAESNIYGIDLGTTFSAIARVNQQGDSVCLNLGDDGEWTIPSAVLFDGSKVFVGAEAIENCYRPDTQLVEFSKRVIGLSNTPGWPKQYGGWNYTPEEVSALVLRKVVRQIAGQHTLPPVRDVVVSHPQWFFMSQKETTREAVELAGLNLVGTITEPHAAAIAYGIVAQAETRELTVLVFDLGGGTFDLSLIRIGHNRFQMIGSDGDTQLGGIDWDHLIVARAMEKFRSATGDNFEDVMSDEDEVVLRKAAERAKKKLSDTSEIGFWVTGGGNKTRVDLTRAEYEEMSHPLVVRCIDKCNRLFQQTSHDWSKIDEVLMVGSSTKMPMIQEAVKRLLGREPLIDKDPKLMVAKGAAIWGEWIKAGKVDPNAMQEPEETSGLSDLEMPSVVGRTAHGLGILATKATPPGSDSETTTTIVSRLIEQNTATPYVYEKTFYTNKDNETAIVVPLYEGESDNPKDCIRIGQVALRDLPPARPKLQPVKVKFNIDVSGLLEVEMTDVGTTRSERMRLDRNVLRDQLSRSGVSSDFEARRRHLDQLELV